MKNVVIALLLSIAGCQLSIGQIGTWRNHLAYHDVQEIAATGSGQLFVRASNGLYQYNQNDQSITTYDKVSGLSDVNISHISWCQQARRLVVVYRNSNIDLVETNGNVTNISSIYTKAITGDKTINAVTISGQYAYLACGFGIVKLNVKDAEVAESYMLDRVVNAVALSDGSIYAQTPDGVLTARLDANLLDKGNWTAAASAPSFEQDHSAYDDNIALVETLNPGGPHYNTFYESKFVNGRLYTTGGQFLPGQSEADSPGTVQIFDGSDWTIYPRDINTTTGFAYQDIDCIDVDPTDNNHVAVGGRCGLYEFQDGQLKAYHYKGNSPVQPVMNAEGTALPDDYTLVLGIKYDRQGNLWVLNSQTKTANLLLLTKDGQWENHSKSELYYTADISCAGMRNVIMDGQDRLWFVNANHLRPAVFCYDPATDQVTTYESLTNQDGVNYRANNLVYDVKEDKSGNMWTATVFGPFMIRKEDIGDEKAPYYQEKVPRNDGTNYADYLLANTQINSIAIDGGGRKWFGTSSNGAFLISADNMTQIQHFTTENSPLLSNNVQSVAINDKTGEVFFLTDEGLCSYVSDATETNTEMTKDNVWAYPNPVTPDYTGPITITGLAYDADVKILSASGALIHQGRSNGGTYVWDGCDRRGDRVASGVYMVATATSEGERGTVCKIAVVR